MKKQRLEILKVINSLIKLEMHDKSEFKELFQEEELLGDTGLDSFDFIMVFLKLGTAYGIEDKIFKDKLTNSNPSIKELLDVILEYKTADLTYDEIMKKM